MQTRNTTVPNRWIHLLQMVMFSLLSPMIGIFCMTYHCKHTRIYGTILFFTGSILWFLFLLTVKAAIR